MRILAADAGMLAPRPVAALTLAAALLALAVLGAPDCDTDDNQRACPAATHGLADLPTFISQYVPQSVHSKKTRAGRRKASIAARQPSCGTLVTVSARRNWRECDPGSERCSRMVQILENASVVLPLSTAFNISIVHVEATTDNASSSFVREATSLAYKTHGQPSNLTVWFIPAMVVAGGPYDMSSMFARVLIGSFEIPEAVAASSSDALLHFLSDRCDVNLPTQPDFPGRMIRAIQTGDLESVSRLVDTGSSVDPTNARGEPCINTSWEQECFRPLHTAIAFANCDADLNVARVLLRGGADVERRGADGQSLLHRVAWDWVKFPTEVGSSDNPKNILAAWLMNKSPIGLGHIDDLGQTVFHVAARYHHIWMLEHLLSHSKFWVAKGVIGLSDNSGNTVLHYAAGGTIWYRGISSAKAIVASVATDDTQQRAWAHDNPAIYDGYSICRQDLYRHETNTNRMPARTGTFAELSTIMSTCGFFGRMVSLLLTTKYLPATTVNMRNHAGDTPLHLAALANDPVVVRLLISSGADVEAKNERGLVAEEVAAIHGSDEAALSLSKSRRFAEPLPLTRERVWQSHARFGTATESSRANSDTVAERLLTALATGIQSANHGGWNPSTAIRPANQGGIADLVSDLACGVVRKNRISSSEFVDDMVSLSRPALISPFSYTQLKQWRVLEKWKRQELLSAYGDLTVHVRRDQSGDSTSLSQMSMREFVASWEQHHDDMERPGYVSDATTATYRLLRDLEWGEKQGDVDRGPAQNSTVEVNRAVIYLLLLGCIILVSQLTAKLYLLLQWVAGIPFFSTAHLRASAFEFNLGPPRSGMNMRFCGHQLDVVSPKRIYCTSFCVFKPL